MMLPCVEMCKAGERTGGHDMQNISGPLFWLCFKCGIHIRCPSISIKIVFALHSEDL